MLEVKADWAAMNKVSLCLAHVISQIYFIASSSFFAFLSYYLARLEAVLLGVWSLYKPKYGRVISLISL